MKRGYYLIILMVLMMSDINITNRAVGAEPVDLSGLHKPTYYPYPMATTSSGRMAAPLDTPIARSVSQSNFQENEKDQIQVQFRFVGESNEPLPGAQFTGHDGEENLVQGITDNKGEVIIAGVPGNWKFLIYVFGYFSKAMIYPFTYSTTAVLKLQPSGDLEELDLNGHENKKDLLPIKKIIIPAFCSNTTGQESDLPIDQSTQTGDDSTYTGDEG